MALRSRVITDSNKMLRIIDNISDSEKLSNDYEVTVTILWNRPHANIQMFLKVTIWTTNSQSKVVVNWEWTVMTQHLAWIRLSVTVMIIGVPEMPARSIRPSRSISIRETFLFFLNMYASLCMMTSHCVLAVRMISVYILNFYDLYTFQ